MRLIDIYARLKELKISVFRTHDIMAYLNLNKVNASTVLARLEKAGHLIRLKRGLWLLPGKTDTIALAEYLTSPFPSYISLQSALYFHGLISQIPETIYAVSPARTRVYRTKLGVFSIHHVNPTFFFGYEAILPQGYKMAKPEKALLDFLYLSPTKSNLFRSLPELEFARTFSIKTAGQMIKRAGHSRRITMLNKKFARFISAHFSH